jgi:Rrf2 family iron-sulfur cluster assembly transcriptional regulator
MRLTTKGRYGVRAIINLAAAYANRPISIKTIASEEGISPEFLEQIFFRLKKTGIISSVRGPGGGFVLSRKTSDISIKDILDAVGETTFPVPCTYPDDQELCDRKENCVMVDTWKAFSDMIDGFLKNLTVKDILDKSGVKYYEDIKAGQNFSI